MDLPCSQPPREIDCEAFNEVEQGLFSYFLMKDSKVTLTWILMDKFLLENSSRVHAEKCQPSLSGLQTLEFQGDSQRVLVTFQ